MPAREKRTGPESEADFPALIVSGCTALGLAITPAAVARLELYYRELKHWSLRSNLIAKETTDRQIIENHFLDSLTLLTQLAACERVHLLDVGSGAGFPGLVCKAARPEIALTLVEPRLKRVSFLRHITRVLKLANVQVHACRIEDEVLPSSEMPVTHITSRALNDIGTFLAMVGKFSTPDVEIVCMKGPKWRQEMDIPAAGIRSGNLQLVRTLDLILPFSGARRTLVVLKILAKSA